ncbi:MAG: RNA methyltransferase [Clostridiales bacterium]|nr:RNA methyltransferase [Clostridiales bacterium]
MIITSKSNPIIKDIIKLQSDKKFRIAEKSYIVEGIKPVKECIAAGLDIRKIICTEELSDIFNSAQMVSESVFNAISSEKTPQGVLAIVGLPENELQPPKNSCILLDRIQDPGNFGTIIRTANAAGYSEIYAINCTDAYSPKAVRASMSGIFFVKVYAGTCEEILSVLEGVPLICADMSGEDIFNFVPPEKFCLCIGNEGGGLSAEIKDKSHFKVKIPMQETCESLNAAVSAGIVMYQLKYRK